MPKDTTLRARSPNLLMSEGPQSTFHRFNVNERQGYERGLQSLRERTLFTSQGLLFRSPLYGTLRDGGVDHTLGSWGGWADRYHAILYTKYQAVPAWAANPPRWSGPAGRNRNAFRQPQPGTKVIALADALKKNMAFIRAARGH
jgi:hypothetical protein